MRGTACRPYGSEMALSVGDVDIRDPDISVYCDQPPRDALSQSNQLDDPTVVIEVLAPSMATLDQGENLEEYQALANIRTIAFIDPVNELCRTPERQAEGGWLDRVFSATRRVRVPALDLTIPHSEIFARD